MGSIADNTRAAFMANRMSKAELNAAGVSMAHDWRPRGIGWRCCTRIVRTSDWNREASRGRAASQLIERIDALTLAASGTFQHANGEALPW